MSNDRCDNAEMVPLLYGSTRQCTAFGASSFILKKTEENRFWLDGHACYFQTLKGEEIGLNSLVEYPKNDVLWRLLSD